MALLKEQNGENASQIISQLGWTIPEEQRDTSLTTAIPSKGTDLQNSGRELRSDVKTDHIQNSQIPDDNNLSKENKREGHVSIPIAKERRERSKSQQEMQETSSKTVLPASPDERKLRNVKEQMKSSDTSVSSEINGDKTVDMEPDSSLHVVAR